MPRQGKTSSEREAVVARFEAAAKLIEVFAPNAVIRLPSPREGVVMVEIDLDSIEMLVKELLDERRGIDQPPDGRPYPNLRLMLTHGRYYSAESAQAEIAAVIAFVDGKR